MAKIATIHLLVNEDEEAAIADGLNDALRGITHPMGSGSAPRSFILDYSFAALTAEVSPEIEKTLKEGVYLEGHAFTDAAGTDFYLMVMLGDTDPTLQGPFTSEDARLEAARVYRESEGNDDGLYRLDVPRGVTPLLDSFSGGELATPEDPFITHVLERLTAGEETICRLLTPGVSYFTVQYEGDEVLFSAGMLETVEASLRDKLVMVEGRGTQVLVTSAKAAEGYPIHDWVSEVTNGDTRLGYEAWVDRNV
ncbi:MAG: hypothetical protein Q7U28_09260 [Aquabacterium sp.]|nr:hypothetical protein [Aquabacterium sp.]